MRKAKATITYKGQITLPKDIRERLNVKPGDRVYFRETEAGAIVVEADTVELTELCGAVQPRRKGVTLADMEAAIRTGATKAP